MGGALAELATVQLPVDRFREAAAHLRRPFTPEAVKFKVQSVFKDAKGCLIVPYIDARLVVERINLVCPHLWTGEDYAPHGDNSTWCVLTIGEITRRSIGDGRGKAGESDALKRAAVKFGVGVSIYALPQITLWLSGEKPGKERIEKRPSKQGDTLVLTEFGHTKLRDGYAKWLENHGEAKFGPVLDHGDVEGETIDVEAELELEEFVPAAPAAVDDEKGRELIERCRSIYAEISDLGESARRILSPGKFNGYLVGAQHSHEELEKLVVFLEDRKVKIAEQLGPELASLSDIQRAVGKGRS